MNEKASLFQLNLNQFVAGAALAATVGSVLVGAMFLGTAAKLVSDFSPELGLDVLPSIVAPMSLAA